MKYCHEECINKEWQLLESDGGSYVPVKHIKKFECLAEVRKAFIVYTKNPDFQHLDFRISLISDANVATGEGGKDANN